MCGEPDTWPVSVVIKIASLILQTSMDIFIAVLIDYTCIAKLIALAKSTAILEKTTLATIHPLGQRRDCCVEVCLISINEEEGDVWSLI